MSREKEQPSGIEINPELVHALKTVFFNRIDCYALQNAKGAYWSVKEPVTDNHIAAHLQGKLSLGVHALDSNSNAKWLCFDADDDAQWLILLSAAPYLQADGITPYLETSRRGGHLWLFVTPLSGQQIRQFGKALLQKYELGKLELYPKQEMLKTGAGSLVRLPFGIHRKTGKRYHFITPDGEPLAPTIRQQIALLATPMLVPYSTIAEISTAFSEKLPSPSPPPLPKVNVSSGEYLSERLKSAVSVHEFVSRYVELDRNGKGLCPFHDDHIKSFQVNEAENYWSCYAGCGGGSLIDFWMLWRTTRGQDGSFTATVKELANILFSH